MSTQEIIPDGNIQVVTFHLIDGNDNNILNKKELYAIPIEQVKEITILDRITPIPRSKDYVLGIMNLRGQIISVIDVTKKLKSNTKGYDHSSASSIIVAEYDNILTGLLVKDVDSVLSIQKNRIQDAPKRSIEIDNYIKGIIKTKDQLIILFDAIKLIKNSSNKDQSGA